MASAKTSSFWLTETITLPLGSASGTRVQDTIDLGAYVDVGDQQAISIEQVDFIYQVSSDFGGDVGAMLVANGGIQAQLSDLNPSTAFVRADSNSLVASGSLSIDQANNIATRSSDIFPDNFGKESEARMVINDSLYLVAGNDSSAIGAAAVYVTCRIKCKIVKLSAKDWMAVAVQRTAAAN